MMSLGSPMILGYVDIFLDKQQLTFAWAVECPIVVFSLGCY
jgi:hypothetical protein